MYNFNPKGQQPRLSYNMLYSHLKLLGYTDELAGIEAHKFMKQVNSLNQQSNPLNQQSNSFNQQSNPLNQQSNSFNQQPNVQTNTSQFNQNMYRDTNYNAAGYNLNSNVFNQQVQPIQGINPPQIKQSFNLGFESLSNQANYDKNNLLSGVKISSKATPPFPSLQLNDPLDPLKTRKRPPLDPRTLAEIFNTESVQPLQCDPAHPITLLYQKQNPPSNPFLIGHDLPPESPLVKSVPGYSLNQPPPPSYPYKQPVGTVPQPNVRCSGIMPQNPPKMPSPFSLDNKLLTPNKNNEMPSPFCLDNRGAPNKIPSPFYLDNKGTPNQNKQNEMPSPFYLDTKGTTPNQNKQNEDTASLTIVQVNRWIQDLYLHLNMTTCSKTLRKAVNTYIQHVMEKFRNGTLTMNELKMLSPDEIMNFKPTNVEQPREIMNFKSKNVEPRETMNFKSTNVEPREIMNFKPKNVEKPREIQHLNPKQDLNTEFETKNVIHPPANMFKSKSSKAPNMYRALQNQINDYLSVPVDKNEIHRREQRSHRFKNTNTKPTYNFNPVKGKKIVGLNQDIEKPYLRLTSAPNPLIVRPEQVLVKSFKHVFDKFMRTRNYTYIQEQFRSIRQDIQVQHLKSPFVVRMYTTNARLAMLHNDLDQFNQCQTQLKHLLVNSNDCQQLQFEFEMYYMLYLALQNMSMGLIRYLKENHVNQTCESNPKLENQFKKTIYFKFANEVRVSISEGNFIKYFKLANTKKIDHSYYLHRIYKDAFDTRKPRDIKQKHKNFYDTDSMFYVKLLFKMFENKLRMFSLYTLCRSSLTLSIELLTDILNFSSEDDCLNFLKRNKITFSSSKLVDCKRSLDSIANSPLMRSKKT